MHTYWLVFSVGVFISLIGYIWLTVVGFKRSVVWGLVVLLFSPLGAIIFAIANWYEAKKAFLVYAAAMVLMVGVGIGLFTTVGVPFIQIAQRLKNHELTREQADYQATYLFKTGHLPPKQESADTDSGETDGKSAAVATAKTDGKSTAVATAKTDDKSTAVATTKAGDKNRAVDRGEKAQQKTKRVNDSSTNLASTGKQADANSTANPRADEPASPPNINDVPADPLQQKSALPDSRMVAVSMGRMSHYLGRYFIITVKGGTQHRGLLRKVERRQLILERKLYGGKFEYGIRKDKIKSIRMLKYIPDAEQ